MKNRLLFLGPPGAGKGTQAQKLCQSHDLLHLSTGDLLRAEVMKGSALGEEVSLIMSKGELVSDELVLAIVKSCLSNRNGKWVLDGFPRNLIQAELLENLLEGMKQPIEAVILLELSDEILLKRLLARGRTDDNEQVIRHRLEVYREKTAPLILRYRHQGLIKEVQADGSVEEIGGQIQKILI